MNPRRSFLIVLLALAAVGVSLFAQYRNFVTTPLTLSGERVVTVPRGASVRSFLADLEAAGVTRRDWRWRVFNRLHPVTIQTGEYLIRPGMRPQDLLELLASGRVVKYAFTIVEGWNFSRLKQELVADPVLASAQSDPPDDAELMAGLGQPGQPPEGWFLPETYHFVRGDTAIDILRRAHTAMQEALSDAWKRRGDIPLRSPYELLILASIVEKETAVPSERARIAGVFTRRLEQGWRLETDPSVIYGLGESFDGNIRKRDLQTDSPYNTYTRYGLPPTPIALPGKDSLLAAARPAAGTAMFFVADGTGGHVFSDTLEDHNAAVRRMLGKN